MLLQRHIAVVGFPMALASAADHGPATTWPTRGHFHLGFGAQQTDPLGPAATAAEIEAALRALGSIGDGNVQVTQGPLPASAARIEFLGSLGQSEQPLLGIEKELAGGVGTTLTISRLQPGQPGRNRIDRITGDPNVNTGSFTLSVSAGGQTCITTDISFAPVGGAAEIQAALEALPNVGAGNIQCSGPPLPEGPIDLEWQGALAGAAGPTEVTLDSTALQGGQYAISLYQAPNVGQNEIQALTMGHGAVQAWLVRDGGPQQAIAATPVDRGHGQWTIDLTAAETDAAMLGLLLEAADCLPAHCAVRTVGYDLAAPGILVAGYAAGQSPAALILAQPDQRLLTDAQGRVRVAANDDKTDYGLAAADRAALAQAVLAQDVAAVEASAAAHSLCYVILAMSEARTTAQPGRLSVYRSDGQTLFAEKLLTSDASAAPITGIATP